MTPITLSGLFEKHVKLVTTSNHIAVFYGILSKVDDVGVCIQSDEGLGPVFFPWSSIGFIRLA